MSEGITAAVATGENLDDISQFTPLIANGAVDVVQVGSGTTGITGAMMVADLAYAFELPVSMMNCPANFMAHLAAALPNHMMMEVVAVGRDLAMQVDQTMEDGWIVLGDSPGLGITYDETKLDSLAVDAASPGTGASPWGRRRGAALYEVGPSEPDWIDEE